MVPRRFGAKGERLRRTRRELCGQTVRGEADASASWGSASQDLREGEVSALGAGRELRLSPSQDRAHLRPGKRAGVCQAGGSGGPTGRPRQSVPVSGTVTGVGPGTDATWTA